MNLSESYVLARAVVRTLLDSEQTQEIHRVEEISGRAHYRAFLQRIRGHEGAELLLRDRPELCSDQVDFAALRALPPDTLGYRYAHFLAEHGLDADFQAMETRYIRDPDMAYFMRRFRQTHDVWHALLGLGPAGHEEVIIHAFSWGQLRLPVSALIVIFGSLKHIVLERRWNALRHGLMEAYRSGRDAEPLLTVRWEDLWEQPIAEVHARYNIKPCTPRWVHG